MNEKVKLPKFMCVWLEVRQLATSYPISLIGNIDTVRANNDDVAKWLAFNKSNQWLLIDALRYGYEPEPEPQWGIKAGNYYVHRCEYELIKLTKSLSLARVYTKESTEQMVKALGFGEVVDLNKEGNENDN